MVSKKNGFVKEMQRGFEQIVKSIVPRSIYKDKEGESNKDCEYWIQKGNMVEHGH